MTGFGMFSQPIRRGAGDMEEWLPRISGNIDQQVRYLASMRRWARQEKFYRLAKSIEGWIEDLQSVETRIDEAKRAGVSWWR